MPEIWTLQFNMRLGIIILFISFCQAEYGQEIKSLPILPFPSEFQFIPKDSVLENNAYDRMLLYENKRMMVSPVDKQMSDSAKFAETFGSFEIFKRKFLALKLDNELPDLGLPKGSHSKPQLLDKDYISSPAFALSSPISFFYYNFSKIEQSKRKLAEWYAYAPIREKIEAKYNRKKLERWTGLNDHDLTQFIVFCSFRDSFLLNTNEYDLIVVVQLKLEIFKLLNSIPDK